MIYYLKVSAKNRSTGEVTVYNQVYDISHYYGYNVSKDTEGSALRLLIGKPFSRDENRREYINLLENDVGITLDSQEQLEPTESLAVDENGWVL
jgi:hypothetical protein